MRSWQHKNSFERSRCAGSRSSHSTLTSTRTTRQSDQLRPEEKQDARCHRTVQGPALQTLNAPCEHRFHLQRNLVQVNEKGPWAVSRPGDRTPAPGTDRQAHTEPLCSLWVYKHNNLSQLSNVDRSVPVLVIPAYNHSTSEKERRFLSQKLQIVMVHVSTPNTYEALQADQEFKVSLRYRRSERPNYATQKNKTKNKSTKRKPKQNLNTSFSKEKHIATFRGRGT